MSPQGCIRSEADGHEFAFGGGGLGHALAVRSDGTVWAWGYNDRGQLGNGSTTASSVPVQVASLNLNRS
ncbi:MAG TPA: RCC1 domain-containing protein [Burkholderiaceae bacterium]|nr:RCC1 domain-containing protein [Burkholderiaceae bacterium]